MKWSNMMMCDKYGGEVAQSVRTQAGQLAGVEQQGIVATRVVNVERRVAGRAVDQADAGDGARFRHLSEFAHAAHDARAAGDSGLEIRDSGLEIRDSGLEIPDSEIELLAESGSVIENWGSKLLLLGHEEDPQVVDQPRVRPKPDVDFLG